MKRIFNLVLSTVLLLLFFHIAPSFAQTSGYKVSGSIEIGGESRWDYCIVDTLNHRLFVSHSDRIHIVDLITKKVTGEITGLNGVHGIAFAYDLNKGYISNGRSDSVTVFDMKTLKVTGNIHVTGKNPDAIIYDPASQRIFTFNGRSSNATAIDAGTDTIAGTVKLDGKPEFSAPDLKGNMYVNIEDKSLIEKFDSKQLKVLNKWPIAPCEEPSGLAIDIKNNRIFAVGSNKKMAVLDFATGKVVATVPIGNRPDACAFDPVTGLVFSSNGEGSLTVIKQVSSDSYKVIDTIPTMKGLRTLSLDPSTHNIYLIGMIEGKDKKMSFGVMIVSKF
ncbi:MAG: YncE family protein [Bacteroidota bacterium]|nr:YncE family protein [Bacteroidota bacterium]